MYLKRVQYKYVYIKYITVAIEYEAPRVTHRITRETIRYPKTYR